MNIFPFPVMQMEFRDPPRNFYKRNADGRGFKIKRGVITAFEQRQLFLKDNKSNARADETTSEGIATTRFTGTETNISLIPRSKRIVDDNEDESSKEAGISLKQLKQTLKVSKDAQHETAIVEDGEMSVEEILFSNDLVRWIIFSHLSVQDLKSSRQVNRLWYLEATKILHKRDTIASIQISNGGVSFHNAAVYKRPVSLEELQYILENSKLFPNPNFAITNERLDSIVHHFFYENGHHVKSLCVEAVSSQRGYPHVPASNELTSTVSYVHWLAANYLPNLQILKFWGDHRSQIDKFIEMSIENSPKLANLQSLNLSGDFQPGAISLILNNARNIKNIYLHKSKNSSQDQDYYRVLDKLIKIKNVVPRLRNLKLIFYPGALKIFEEILKQNPRLFSIEEIDADPEKDPRLRVVGVGRFLTALFQKCKESLTEILGIKCLGHLYGLNFPVFASVKRLGLIYSEMKFPGPANSPLIPLLPSGVGVNLGESFPNLSTVEFRFTSRIANLDVDNILPATLNPLLSVRCLKVDWVTGDMVGNVMERISAKFPNVTSAKFENMLDDSAYEHIWKLSKLEELEIVILTEMNMNLFPALDSAFTGFSKDVVENLARKYLAGIKVSAGVAELRTKPFIGDLKELRKLSIRLGLYSVDNEVVEYTRATYATFDDDAEETLGEKDVCFDPGYRQDLLQVKGKTVLSYITKRFGFDLCPQLKSNVSVGVKHYTKLNSEAILDQNH